MLNVNDIVNMYTEQQCSTYVIAKKYDTYPNKIRRLLLKQGIQLDDKSTAQKKALDAGRSSHPTAGIKRDSKVKEKISESIYTYWQNMSDQERQKRAEDSRRQWEGMTEAEKKDFQKRAVQAVREASKKGSKMERFLLDQLTKQGYNIIFHKKQLFTHNELEIDLLLPELQVVIEIDGPSHFFPIWGETEEKRQKNLQRQIQSDTHKTGLILSHDFVMIRVKNIAKNLSEKTKRDVLKKIVKTLKAIEKKFPPKNKRYIELEVN